MERILVKEQYEELYHFINRKKIKGIHKNLIGDCSGLKGDCSDLSGDCSGLYGDCTGLRGELDKAMLSEEERKKGIYILCLVKEEE